MLLVWPLLVLFSLVFCAEDRNVFFRAAQVLELLQNGELDAAAELFIADQARPDRLTARHYALLKGIHAQFSWFDAYDCYFFKKTPSDDFPPKRRSVAAAKWVTLAVLTKVMASDREDLKARFDEDVNNYTNIVRLYCSASTILHEFEVDEERVKSAFDMNVLQTKMETHNGLIRSPLPIRTLGWTIRRGEILKDALRILIGNSIELLKNETFFARFDGEDDNHTATSFHEFILLTCEALFHSELFVALPNADNKLHINPETSFHLESTGPGSRKSEYTQLYSCVGRFMAFCILKDMVLPIQLVLPFFRAITDPGTNVSRANLSEIDSELAVQLRDMLKYEPEEVNDLDLTFTITKFVNGREKTFELLPGGADMPVTYNNVNIYVNKYARFEMWTQIQKQAELIRSGFNEFIPLDEFKKYFNPKEFEALLTKHMPINVQDWKRHTTVHHPSPRHEVLINYLWELLADDRPFRVNENLLVSADDKRASFLFFWTGARRAPPTGFANIGLRIDCMHYPGVMRVFTCFKILNLYELTEVKFLEAFNAIIAQYITASTGD